MLDNVSKIKEVYPNPISLPVQAENIDDLYCVMGAFTKYNPNIFYYQNSAFPEVSDMTKNIRANYISLQRYPLISIRNKVQGIIKANDNGNFDKAWDSLQKLIDFINNSEADFYKDIN